MLKRGLPLLLTFGVLSACGERAEPPPAPLKKAKGGALPQVAVPATQEPDRAAPVAQAPAEAGGADEAAAVLKTYYALIEAGKYREAWKLRSSERGGDEGAFVESFGKYASYRATVGTPSQVASAGGWLYVEVPVHIYGQTRSGEGFGSAGSVSLRRKEKGSAAQRQWRIYS